MQILKANLGNYRNEEHFQFQTECKGLVEKYSPENLNIGAAWVVYLTAYNKEAGALDVIQKSTVTEAIAKADQRRDDLNSGLAHTVKGATSHFDSAKKKAAERIQVALDHYGNINRKSYDEETAAINSLINDLNERYAANIATLGLGEWVTELQSANNAFVVLMQERYSEDAGKPQYNMKTARQETDKAYRTITERIDALMIVNGEDAYAGFVNEINQRVEKYNAILARREGRNAKEEAE